MTTMAEALQTISNVSFGDMSAPHAEKVAAFLERAVVEITDREAAVTKRERLVNDREAAVQLREDNATARLKALDSYTRVQNALQPRKKSSWLLRG
jgi:hypothetical protein